MSSDFTINAAHLDLLLSKLFHDLISPVSAARNGLELAREFGGDEVGSDALDLVAQSVDQASDRLVFFRMAFGGAGSGGGLEMSHVPDLLTRYLATRKTKVDLSAWFPGAAPVGAAKPVLAAGAVAADFLTRQGTVVVAASGASVEFRADGRGAVMSDEVRAALSAAAAEVTSDTVLAATVRATADRFGVRLDPDGSEPKITLTW